MDSAIPRCSNGASTMSDSPAPDQHQQPSSHGHRAGLVPACRFEVAQGSRAGLGAASSATIPWSVAWLREMSACGECSLDSPSWAWTFMRKLSATRALCAPSLGTKSKEPCRGHVLTDVGEPSPVLEVPDGLPRLEPHEQILAQAQLLRELRPLLVLPTVETVSTVSLER
mmetsp:Transcript_99051/g.275701  ORF Transcript_99051/g.275701 Transcript_99051/m.275701 type:complete len:170 (-) Transcript_99051:138-647(-)